MITQEFNKVTTTSNFIKNLLISTYLPLIRTVRDFDYIVADLKTSIERTEGK